MLAELSRREKAANIKPDPDVDIYMKVTHTQTQSKYTPRIYSRNDLTSLGRR